QLARIGVNETGQMSMFSDAELASGASKPIAPPDFPLIVVQDEAALAALVKALSSATLIAFDTETTSLDQMAAALVGISLSADGETGYYIPVGHRSGQQLDAATVIEALRGPLSDPNIPKVAHNANYDLVVMEQAGISVTPLTFDTMLAEWVCDPGSTRLGLKNLVQSELHITMTEIDALLGSGKNQITMDAVEIERAAPYAAADAVYTYQLHDRLQRHLNEIDDPPAVDPLWGTENPPTPQDVFNQLEMPLLPVIVSMERAGVLLDTSVLKEMSKKLSADLAALEQEIYGLSGGYGEFNINSPKQLNDVLFGKLGLSVEGIRKTARGYSTAASVLENLRGEHPIIEKILGYRELSKLKGTYVDALPALINPATGRVHTSYNQAGASTGRLSSSNPNLQNIPIRTEIGREVRRAFVTPPARVLLSVDYSQVELRILAHATQEQTLLDAFHQGQDIHATTAAIVNGIPLDQVTYEQRSFAKRVNFGLLYGMGAFRLARDSNLTLAQAREFINTYFERLPNIKAYMDRTPKIAKEHGYLTTLFGRRKRFPGLNASNHTVRQQTEREAINMPIQGTAADIIKKAMIELAAALQQQGLGGRMILQVHDELVLEVPEDQLEQTAALVVSTMENTYALTAPLRANAQAGHNWHDMADLAV
ncbi:MAG: DNA polymerase I, partial [Chloroflexi bacterium]|nr:DNA polymerase I [Chloroflexota bacterium]